MRIFDRQRIAQHRQDVSQYNEILRETVRDRGKTLTHPITSTDRLEMAARVAAESSLLGTKVDVDSRGSMIVKPRSPLAKYRLRKARKTKEFMGWLRSKRREGPVMY